MKRHCTYRLKPSALFYRVGSRSPFFMLRDGGHHYDESATLAGVVKETHEALEREIGNVSRLAFPSYAAQEDRARSLLESLIDAKRAYLEAERRRRGQEA